MFSNIHNPYSFFNVSDKVAHSCEATGKDIVSYSFSRFQIGDGKTYSKLTGAKHSWSAIYIKNIKVVSLQAENQTRDITAVFSRILYVRSYR
jgi:hypothetical protein